MELASRELDQVVIKFAGDSGDGMQLTGVQFSDTSAVLGNDISTFPNYPAEIRAPRGTLGGVSGFQIQFGQVEINTPGDSVDVLVAMNPAALKTNLISINDGKTIIIDSDSFTSKDYKKAGYDVDPLEDGSLEKYNLVKAPITSLTKEVLKDSGLGIKDITRSRNMFALGMVYWLFSRSLDYTEQFISSKFKSKQDIAEANKAVLRAGFNYAETVEELPSAYTVLPAKLEKGTYRNIMGNTALAWGFLAASEKSKLPLFLGSYPITPASDILHEFSRHQNLGVKIFQAEDEIASVSSAVGASFAGNLAITTTSGPGFALKGEAIGLAVMTELPLVVINVQRGGPSTGLPTKTEQSDLLQAMFGRNGECPAIIIAPSTPGNCYDFAYEASRLAIEHMTPVVLLSDGYIANGSEPWKIKETSNLPEIKPPFITKSDSETAQFDRDEDKLSRGWAIPGTKDLEHRVGGLEKDYNTGNISYDPANHEKMVKLRQEKVKRVENFISEQEVYGAKEGDLLVVGWGGTYGSLLTATKALEKKGRKIGLAHFNYMNPLPRNVKDIFSKYKKIVVCELNMGQFAAMLRMQYPEFDYIQYNKVQGMPFMVKDLVEKFEAEL